MDELAMLRAAVQFSARLGRSPRRRDFKEDRARWEEATGLELPAATSVERLFGSWNRYLDAAGLSPARREDYASIEEAALRHVRETYPNFEPVTAEANAFDGYLGAERVEVKGSVLSGRLLKGRRVDYFNFKTHARDLHKSVDKLICVGLGIDPESGEYVPLTRFVFPKVALGLVSNKATVMVYTTSVFGPGTSLYSAYLDWKAPLREAEVLTYSRYAEKEAAAKTPTTA